MKTPGGRRGRDIDDAHAERFHGRRLAEALGEPSKAASKPASRRTGREPSATPSRNLERNPEQKSESPQRTTAAHLAFVDDHRRAQRARPAGHDLTPSLDDAVEALLDAERDASREATAVLPLAPRQGHPDLPEPEIRPPAFLTPFQAMRDIYLRVKGRASPRARSLLEGAALEDLVGHVRAISAREDLARSPDARLVRPLLAKLEDDPGPLLLGLGDPRLSEPWRLFLDGWDLWRPEGWDQGVELFWEGEAEDDQGAAIEILQCLSLVEGEVVLMTKVGALEDEITFDGDGFYRLRTKKPAPREVR